ncbi:hypothetical protein [Singulisphaera acidiphila]|uniref:Uncharacterized protein n=1 Tax=Singulisphaera acidiphila (strain ATCC BAA-1392 / DSM 18658 / VKM B-2454 / MOB10) TaxID=886293 RepID=L0DH86_SINAD|nr:hypothetical protein [Singulisphaera acidiphila]AGA28031.1 hypothetical protein Sinac_3798 [Singulisphaera acidiphila DSM 18658]
MLGSLALLSALVASGSYSDSIEVNFSDQAYDRTLFRPNVRRSLGRWEVKDGKLRAEIPKGGGDRPPIGFVGLFHLEGDFEVTADYQIVALPKPKASSTKKGGDAMNSIELVISGAPGWCVGSRKFLSIGEKVSSYGELEGSRKFISDNLPVSGTIGRLEVRRKDGNIQFYHAEAGSTPVLIGTVPFGDGPVNEVGLQVYAMNTVDALDVRFSHVQVGADRIIRGLLDSSSTRQMLLWGLLALVVAALVYAWWRFAGHRSATASGSHSRRGGIRVGLMVAVASHGVVVASHEVAAGRPSPTPGDRCLRPNFLTRSLGPQSADGGRQILGNRPFFCCLKGMAK